MRVRNVDVMKDKIDIQKSNYGWLLNSINNADAKAGYIIVLQLALIGYFASRANDLFRATGVLGDFQRVLFIILFIAFSISIILGLILSGKVLTPRFGEKQRSIFYFRSIKNLEPNNYNNLVKEMNTDELLDDLNRQIHEISTIVTGKFKDVRLSFVCFIVAFFSFVGILLIS